MFRFTDLVSELVWLQDHGEVYRPPLRADPEHISLPAEVAGRGGARKTQPGRGSFCSYYCFKLLKETSKSQLPLAGGVRGEGGSRRAVLALQEAEGRDGGNGARDERTQGK